MNAAGRDWRVVFLAVAAGGSGLLAISVAVSAIAYMGIGRWFGQPGSGSSEPIGGMVVAGALTLIAAILLGASHRAFRALRNPEQGSFLPPPLRWWQIAFLLFTWLSASVLAQLLISRDPWKWTAPVWHMLAIGAPLYLLVRVALGGIPGGSRLRLWGALATGLTLGTGLAVAVEIGVLLLTVAAGGVYLVIHPEQVQFLQNLVRQLGQMSSMEEAFSVLEPLLTSPLTFLGLLLAVSVVTPIIEEFAKSTTTWLLFGRLVTAAHGFWSGALSGAGFALFEGLIASAEPTAAWSFILLIRGGSSIMHVVASALAGWGIAAFRNTGRLTRLLGGYVLAIAIHAAWNAAVVAMGYGGVRVALAPAGTDFMGLLTALVGAIVLISLLVLLPVGLVVCNRRLRSPHSPTSPSAPAHAATGAAESRDQEG